MRSRRSSLELGTIPKQTEDVAADVQMARDWKPGTINEAAIKRSRTEAGFRN